MLRFVFSVLSVLGHGDKHELKRFAIQHLRHTKAIIYLKAKNPPLIHERADGGSEINLNGDVLLF